MRLLRGGVCLAVVLAGLVGCGVVGRDRQPTNVVIYVIDTLPADWLQSYGFSQGTSPESDALAADSVLFEQAHSAGPWTYPSIVSLATSMFMCEHGGTSDGEALLPGTPSLATRLASAGYETISLFTNPYVRKTGLADQFDKAQHTYHPWRAAAKWLQKGPVTPFFLYLHTVEPHDSYLPLENDPGRFGVVPEPLVAEINSTLREYRQLAKVDSVSNPHLPLGTTDNTVHQQRLMARLVELQNEVRALYSSEVLRASEHLGEVVRGLKEADLWDSTLFILTSDHGEELGERGGWLHDQSVYDELVRVPLIIRFPKGRFGGTRLQTPVSLVDVVPTVMSYLGRTDLMGTVRGIDLMPLVRRGTGDMVESSPRVTSMRMNSKKYFRPYAEERGNVNVVARQGTWKGIWNLEARSFELYDLAADPGEQVKQAHREARLVRQMTRLAAEEYRACRQLAQDAVSASELDEVEVEGLRSLGYLD